MSNTQRFISTSFSDMTCDGNQIKVDALTNSNRGHVNSLKVIETPKPNSATKEIRLEPEFLESIKFYYNSLPEHVKAIATELEVIQAMQSFQSVARMLERYSDRDYTSDLYELKEELIGCDLSKLFGDEFSNYSIFNSGGNSIILEDSHHPTLVCKWRFDGPENIYSRLGEVLSEDFDLVGYDYYSTSLRELQAPLVSVLYNNYDFTLMEKREHLISMEDVENTNTYEDKLKSLTQVYSKLLREGYHFLDFNSSNVTYDYLTGEWVFVDLDTLVYRENILDENIITKHYEEWIFDTHKFLMSVKDPNIHEKILKGYNEHLKIKNNESGNLMCQTFRTLDRHHSQM